MSWAFQSELAAAVRSELVATAGLVEALRLVKDAGEIARIERACDIADVALRSDQATPHRGRDRGGVRGRARVRDAPPGRRAAVVRDDRRERTERRDAARPADGPRHLARRPRRRRLRRRLRRLPLGHDPHGLRRRAVGRRLPSFSTPSRPPSAPVSSPSRPARPGGRSTRPAASRSPRPGFGEAFSHSTGHGVGLEIHEAPVARRGVRVTSCRKAPSSPSSPGRTSSDHGGARIEDTVVVTDVRVPVAHQDDEGLHALMALSTNDLKNGMALDLPDGLFAVVEFQHVKPGKGGAFVRTKLRNLRTKAVVERTFRADEKVEQAVIDKREMQFLYRDGTDYVFMDNVSLRPDDRPAPPLGARRAVPEGGGLGHPRALRRPRSSTSSCPRRSSSTITDTEPGMQGDRVSGARKPATTRDRPRRPGSALRQPGRPDQGRHPVR